MPCSTSRNHSRRYGCRIITTPRFGGSGVLRPFSRIGSPSGRARTGEFEPTLLPQAACVAIAAAVAPVVAARALAKIAAMAFLQNEVDQLLPPKVAGQLPGGCLVPPHQRGVEDYPARQTQIEGRLQGLDGVV